MSTATDSTDESNSPAATVFQRLAAECGLSLSVNFDGFAVQLRTNSATLKAKLEQYFAAFRTADNSDVLDSTVVFAADVSLPDLGISDWQVKQPEPGKQRVKEHFRKIDEGIIVRKVQTGVHLAYLGSSRICAGPLVENANQVINFVNNIYMDHLLRDHGQLFHAAGVCDGERGLGLAGRSGKGKSTLALKLLETGLDFVSNDRLVVQAADDGLIMRGVPKYPRINPGTIVNQDALLPLASEADLARYRSMSKDALWELEEKYDAFVDECFDGCQFQLAARMSLFVLIDWDRHSADAPMLSPAQPADVIDLIPAVMKAPGIMLPGASRRIPEVSVDDYCGLLAQTSLYVLSGGVDFRLAAELIRQQLIR